MFMTRAKTAAALSITVLSLATVVLCAAWGAPGEAREGGGVAVKQDQPGGGGAIQNEDLKQHSKPVSAGGADFELVADRVWHRPREIYDEAGANIGLRITNRGDKDLMFNVGDTLQVSLKAADAKEADAKQLVQTTILKTFLADNKKFLADKPVRVAAGKSETVMLPTRLVHTRVSKIYLGLNAGAGWYWLTDDDLQPGRYRLSLHYENQQKDNGCWLGKVDTDAVEIEVKAAGASAPEPPSATVVVLQPGDSKDVIIIWHDRAAVRGGCCIVSLKAELPREEADEAQRAYRKGDVEARANGVAGSFDRKRSEEVLKLTGPPEVMPGNKTYLSVIKVSAGKDAKSGVTRLYAHWVGGTTVTDRLGGEILVVVQAK